MNPEISASLRSTSSQGASLKLNVSIGSLPVLVSPNEFVAPGMPIGPRPVEGVVVEGTDGVPTVAGASSGTMATKASPCSAVH